MPLVLERDTRPKLITTSSFRAQVLPSITDVFFIEQKKDSEGRKRQGGGYEVSIDTKAERHDARSVSQRQRCGKRGESKGRRE